MIKERAHKMSEKVLKVLAVDDPAVFAYTDRELGILEKYGKPVEFEIVPWSEYFPKMTDVFEGKASYDIVMIAGHLWAYDLVKKGCLAPLSYEDEDILPVIAREMEYEGKKYLSPSFCDGHIAVYRKSVVKNALGELPGEVISPEEYIRIAKLIFEKENRPSLAMKADASEIFTDALPFLRMFGEDVYTEDGINCGSSKIVEGLEQYCSMKKYALPSTDKFGNGEVADAIRTGKAPLAITWSGQMGVVMAGLDADDLGFATLSTAWNVTWSFAVSTKSGMKAEAEDFLKFLRSPEIDRLAGEKSGAPVRLSSYKAGADSHPWYDCQVRMFENAKPLLCRENAGDLNGVLYGEIAEAFAGRKTPQAAMKDAETKIKEMT